LGLLTTLPRLLLATLLAAMSGLLALLTWLLASAAALLAAVAALLTALVLLARLLFIRVHNCSFVCSPADNEIIAIKFPLAVGPVLELKLRDYVGQKGGKSWVDVSLLCGTLPNDRGRPIHLLTEKLECGLSNEQDR